jgi:hypothetical protein
VLVCVAIVVEQEHAFEVCVIATLLVEELSESEELVFVIVKFVVIVLEVCVTAVQFPESVEFVIVAKHESEEVAAMLVV